jgi:hypothetical protein
MAGSIQLPVHSYNQPSRAPARLVNCYAQQTVGKAPVELVGAPGIESFATLGAGPGRGLFVMRGVLYAVSGTNLYTIDEVGSESLRGTLPGSTKLTFAGNGVEIVFSNKYIWSGGTVSAITDPDLPAVSTIDYVDGYVVYAESGSGRWGCSQLYDGADFNGLDFATAEAYPDDLVCVKVDHRQPVLFGQETTEIWYNSGAAGAGFPFERLAGGFIEYGCLARLGVAKQDNSLFWLANDRTIRRLSGQTPQRVSQHGVEEKLSSYSRVDDAQAFPINWNGHLLVVFRFPAAGATWVFDVTTNEWHERATYGSTTWDVVDTAQCYGKTFVQSASTGAVGYLSDTCYTEFGDILRREWTYPQVYNVNSPVTHSQIDLVARTGTAPIGTVPHVNLEISDDGGNTWALLPPRELGRVGQYNHVVRWNRLGQARDRVYRMSVDDAAVPVYVTDTVLRVE